MGEGLRFLSWVNVALPGTVDSHVIPPRNDMNVGTYNLHVITYRYLLVSTFGLA